MSFAADALNFILACVAGLLLPGYLCSRLLGSRPSVALATALPLSMLILFWGVLVVDALGQPVRFGTVMVWELTVSVLLGIAWHRWPPHGSPAPSPLPGDDAESPKWIERTLIGCVIAMAIVMLVRGVLAPMTGGDALFRWEYFARALLKQESLSFYPPVSARDYAVYFLPDGIAPIVSVSYWWVYAALGRPAEASAMIVVFGQYASLLALAYHSGAALGSRRAGLLASAVLAATPLLFRAVAIAQETGLTALGVAGSILALIAARDRRDLRAFILAGLLAAVAGLAREYGPALIGCGLIVLLGRRLGGRALAIYCLAAALAAGPWYLRNWVRTGNPLYTLEIPPLFKCPNIFAGILATFRELQSPAHWAANVWSYLALCLTLEAGLLLAAGLAGAIWIGRRQIHLTAAALLCIALYVYSMGWTAGLAEYGMRVLAPALMILGLLAGLALDQLMRRRAWRRPIVLLILLSTIYALFLGLIFPELPRNLAVADIPRTIASRYVLKYAEWDMGTAFSQALPRGTRILGENARAQIQLAPLGYELVPIWSPEVAFLFDASLSPIQQRRMLLDRNITAVLFYGSSPNTLYCARHSPFYAADAPNWRPLAWLEGQFTLCDLPRD